MPKGNSCALIGEIIREFQDADAWQAYPLASSLPASTYITILDADIPPLERTRSIGIYRHPDVLRGDHLRDLAEILVYTRQAVPEHVMQVA